MFTVYPVNEELGTRHCRVDMMKQQIIAIMVDAGISQMKVSVDDVADCGFVVKDTATTGGRYQNAGHHALLDTQFSYYSFESEDGVGRGPYTSKLSDIIEETLSILIDFLYEDSDPYKDNSGYLVFNTVDFAMYFANE